MSPVIQLIGLFIYLFIHLLLIGIVCKTVVSRSEAIALQIYLQCNVQAMHAVVYYVCRTHSTVKTSYLDGDLKSARSRTLGTQRKELYFTSTAHICPNSRGLR